MTRRDKIELQRDLGAIATRSKQMIRREEISTDGVRRWVLIDQMEHARLAGEFAAQWGGNIVAAIRMPDIVVPAIYRHDDGWREADRVDAIEIESGRPVQFSEIKMKTAHHIWSRSIDRVAGLGPLAQYMVASHFLRLRQLGDRSSEPAAAEFVRHFQPKCAGWLKRWSAKQQSEDAAELAELAVDQLQFFDALSLWLCCNTLQDSFDLRTPCGVELQMRFVAPDRVEVDPWPFTTDTIGVGLHAIRVAVRTYRDSADFVSQPKTSGRIQWALLPKSAKDSS